MVISDKYRYVFVEIPRTGSTAISKELRENYDGREILHKHANYSEFLKQATAEEKEYLVFAGIRNPLDEVVSLYSKLLNNHLSDFTNDQKQVKNGGWIGKKRLEMFEFVQQNKNFEAYLKKYYNLPYTSNANANKKYCDHIIKFEELDNGFTEVLKKLEIKKKRPLPFTNKTKRDKDFKSFYKSKSTKKHAVKVFGPFMKEWGYKFPKDWPTDNSSALNQLYYETTKTGRSLYLRYVKGGPLKGLSILRNAVE